MDVVVAGLFVLACFGGILTGWWFAYRHEHRCPSGIGIQGKRFGYKVGNYHGYRCALRAGHVERDGTLHTAHRGHGRAWF